MRRTRIICLLTVLAMAVLAAVPAVAWDASTLYNGTRGESVRKLQQKLIDLGFLSGTADGIFGNRTEQAVRDFQKANRLTSDGLAGKQTQAVLFASENPGGQSEPTPPSSGSPEDLPPAACFPETTLPCRSAPAAAGSESCRKR